MPRTNCFCSAYSVVCLFARLIPPFPLFRQLFVDVFSLAFPLFTVCTRILSSNVKHRRGRFSYFCRFFSPPAVVVVVGMRQNYCSSLGKLSNSC